MVACLGDGARSLGRAGVRSRSFGKGDRLGRNHRSGFSQRQGRCHRRGGLRFPCRLSCGHPIRPSERVTRTSRCIAALVCSTLRRSRSRRSRTAWRRAGLCRPWGHLQGPGTEIPAAAIAAAVFCISDRRPGNLAVSQRTEAPLENPLATTQAATVRARGSPWVRRIRLIKSARMACAHGKAVLSLLPCQGACLLSRNLKRTYSRSSPPEVVGVGEKCP